MIQIRPSQISRSQRAFLEADDWAVLMCGGFGSGKTTGLILKILQLVGRNPGVPGLIIGATFGALGANLVSELERICRLTLPEELRPRINRGSSPAIHFSNGAIAHLRSAENVKGYDGLSVGWLAGDEIRHWTKRAYDVAIARVRVKSAPFSQRAFASTPAMHWMADEFDAGKAHRRTIMAPTAENAANLEAQYIDNLRLSYSRRMQRAVIDGEFTVLEGAVYESVDLAQGSPWMTSENISRSLRSNRVVVGFDPGYRRSALVYAIEKSPTDWVVFDEIMLDNTSAAGVVNAMNSRRLDGEPIPVDELWVDPAADSTDEAVGTDVLEVLRAFKYRSGPGALRMLSGYFRGIEFGVEKTRVMLGDPASGIPIRIKFHERLRELERGRERGILRDLQAYSYPADQGRAMRSHPHKDGKTDHANDALRYLAVGKYITSPLRRLDPTLRGEQTLGFRAA